MPVTFFILILLFDLLLIKLLKAKPERKDAIITKTINDIIFILSECLLFMVLLVMPTLGLCVRRGIWKTFSPELKLIKDTKVENIFYSLSEFGQ